jgi:hypothetical protein
MPETRTEFLKASLGEHIHGDHVWAYQRSINQGREVFFLQKSFVKKKQADEGRKSAQLSNLRHYTRM